VAALGLELKPLRRARHPDLALLETGEGVSNAERQLEASLERRTPRAVLSIGLAGALSPTLHAGDLVIAREVRDSNATPDAELVAAATRVQMDSPVHYGTAVTCDRILWQAESKRELARSLAPDETAFVDMESKAIARVCSRHRLPFLILRAISDRLDEDLPLDFNKYRGCDGRVDQKRVAKAALLKPGVWAGLFGLQRRSALCARRLAEFVERLVTLYNRGVFR
jgi:adenosylhomocysteine nucleosidase